MRGEGYWLELINGFQAKKNKNCNKKSVLKNKNIINIKYFDSCKYINMYDYKILKYNISWIIWFQNNNLYFYYYSNLLRL